MTTARPAHMPYRYDFKAFKLCRHVIHICFTHSHTKLCLCIGIMGTSRDILTDNRIQIKGSNVMSKVQTIRQK